MKIFKVTYLQWLKLFVTIALALAPAKVLFDVLCALAGVAIFKLLAG